MEKYINANLTPVLTAIMRNGKIIHFETQVKKPMGIASMTKPATLL